ncbi:chorismate mutase [Thalassospira xiamenensis]|uniref:chorismate mutase n=1 Tax=Thalassospira xiamenensis TaxID=220697 RepID=A0A285U2D8_9PROT|nr:chorismate mutase [Thalassospira xiamenensis]SOC30576.1 Chorismate mutase [Thalassospira xiamenensis]
MAQSDENLANLDLNGLRAEIDDIDQALQSLIIRRTKVVQAVGAYKDQVIAAGGKVKVPYRPAREARIMRTLVDRHNGAFPKTALIQIWREMIAAGTRLEAPYTVALCRNADGVDCWELARLNFGCLNEIVEFDTPREAFYALEEGRAAVGVFPKPELGEAQPWWTLLSDDSPVRIVSKLPFGGRPVGRGEQTEGFVLAAIELEESGDDRTLFIVSLPNEISMDTARKKIVSGIEGVDVLGVTIDEATNNRDFLVDVPGFLTAHASTVRERLNTNGLNAAVIRMIGSYATPIPAEELH